VANDVFRICSLLQYQLCEIKPVFLAAVCIKFSMLRILSYKFSLPLAYGKYEKPMSSSDTAAKFKFIIFLFVAVLLLPFGKAKLL
jgi:hypothetical protein